MIDWKRPYGQIIGQSANGARFAQDGKEYDFTGEEIPLPLPVEVQSEVLDGTTAPTVKRGPGRPKRAAT